MVYNIDIRCGFEGVSPKFRMAQWLSWLERRPVTAEVVSSSLIWVVKFFDNLKWDLSSAGRAPALQAGGHRFEPYRSHSEMQVSMGRFPSGQRGQTVNLLATLSMVRIHLSPFNSYKSIRELNFVCFYMNFLLHIAAGWSSSEARRAHNPKVAGSNPVPATCG